ncbi:MAG: DUF368 domain-containing protein [Lachnospiraceae bacterium]
MFLIFFAIVIGMAMLGDTEGKAADLSFGLVNVLKLFGVGVIASATMVIPGVSGSMMLLVMGYYNPIVATIQAGTVEALVHFNTQENPALLWHHDPDGYRRYCRYFRHCQGD